MAFPPTFSESSFFASSRFTVEKFLSLAWWVSPFLTVAPWKVKVVVRLLSLVSPLLNSANFRFFRQVDPSPTDPYT